MFITLTSRISSASRRTSKMATPNTNVSKSGANKTANISQPIAQSQPQTPQQYILPGAFQFRQFVGNVTHMNSCSRTLMQQPNMTNSDPLLQTILHIYFIVLRCGEFIILQTLIKFISVSARTF